MDSKIYESWKISVPMFGSKLVRRQLLLAFGLPSLILFLILFISSGGAILDSDFKYFFYVLLALFLLTYILVKIIYKGKYSAEFIINESGIGFKTADKERNKSRIVGNLAIILGIFAKSPGAASAGYTSQLNQENFIEWDRVKKVNYYPKDNLIYVIENFASKIAIFCSEENYQRVVGIIQNKIVQ